MADGPNETVEASSYDVDDEGRLLFSLDSDTVATFDPGAWIAIERVGNQLSSVWPDHRVGDLCRTLGRLFVVKWGLGAHHLGPTWKYASETLNDFGALTHQLLADAGLNPDSSDHKLLIEETKVAIAKAFEVPIPKQPLRPSPQLTNHHCPICGDRLVDRPKGLGCPSDKARDPLPDDLVSAIANYQQLPPVPSLPTDFDEQPKQPRSPSSKEFWFCPRDGFRLSVEANEPSRCKSCHGQLPHHMSAVLRSARTHGPFTHPQIVELTDD